MLNKEIVEKLYEPFDSRAIKWIINTTTRSGKLDVSPYVTAHFLIQRLNNLVGVENYSIEIVEQHITHHLGIPTYASVSLCVSIFGVKKCDTGESFASTQVCPSSGKLQKGNRETPCIPNSYVVTKVASLKNANSDALKRALRAFGFGLYLWLYPKKIYADKDEYGNPVVPQQILDDLHQFGKKIQQNALRGYDK